MNKKINDSNIEEYFEIYNNYIKSLSNEVDSAVAISYNSEHNNAPIVVAKGKNLLAKQITTLAKKHNIPIINDSGSVDELMKIGIGSEIPYCMYEAISIILAYVYRLSNDR